MKEEERRLEILKAEAAIRELASRMEGASESARQADDARKSLDAAIKSIDMLRLEFEALRGLSEKSFEEEIKSLSQACELLDTNSRALNKAGENLEKEAKNLEATIDEKTQKLYELVDFRLGSLSQDINLISNKILLIMDQNEASGKRILALQGAIEELSWKLQEFENNVSSNFGEIQELKNQIADSSDRLSSLEQSYVARNSGISGRLRSALIGGGVGMVMLFMILKISMPAP